MVDPFYEQGYYSNVAHGLTFEEEKVNHNTKRLAKEIVSIEKNLTLGDICLGILVLYQIR